MQARQQQEVCCRLCIRIGSAFPMEVDVAISDIHNTKFHTVSVIIMLLNLRQVISRIFSSIYNASQSEYQLFNPHESSLPPKCLQSVLPVALREESWRLAFRQYRRKILGRKNKNDKIEGEKTIVVSVNGCCMRRPIRGLSWKQITNIKGIIGCKD
jgi:hypothetical protein